MLWSSKVFTTPEKLLAQGRPTDDVYLTIYTDDSIVDLYMLTYRRGSPLLMGVRSDHKLSADHIPVLYRSCKKTFFFKVLFFHISQEYHLYSATFPAAKDKKGCTTLSRAGQDTSLFPVDEKAVEYYFASDARYCMNKLFSHTVYFIQCKNLF